MDTIQIANLKCGGCASAITKALKKAGIESVSVDEVGQKVSFDGDSDRARSILSRLGYPEKGSVEAKSLLKKAKSYISCARGKMEQ